jgi:hypothetical protein
VGIIPEKPFLMNETLRVGRGGAGAQVTLMHYFTIAKCFEKQILYYINV